jgi:hypothetical protein
MNILFGSLVIVICILGLSYLIGFALVDRDDVLVVEKGLFYYRVKIGMTYIGYVSLVVVFVVGLIFGFDLLF